MTEHAECDCADSTALLRSQLADAVRVKDAALGELDRALATKDRRAERRAKAAEARLEAVEALCVAVENRMMATAKPSEIRAALSGEAA